MKTISIKNPWSYLICSGLKDIENRTWQTNFRGRVLIHASAKQIKTKDIHFPTNDVWLENVPEDIREMAFYNKNITSAIIGSVEIVDCVINHPSIWAEKTVDWDKKIILYKPIYNWVLANPVLFSKPILNVKGKLSFWDYPVELCHICGQPTDLICMECEKPFCENHSAKYEQFTQIDFDCCSECYESNRNRE